MKTKIIVNSVPELVKENPYQNLLFRNLADLGIGFYSERVFSVGNLIKCRKEVDIIHFHWLFEQARTPWRLIKFLVKLIEARVLGYKIVWTVHNIRPHDYATVFDWIARFCLAHISEAIITHGRYSKDEVEAKFRIRNKIFIIPHANYIGYYPNEKNREESRRRLNIDKNSFVYLFFGLIKRYKGLNNLVESFEKIDGNVILLIAGEEIDGLTGEYLQRKADNNTKIRLFKEYISDTDVQVFFNAADIVVLPFTEITTSGSLMLALSFGKPVVSVRKGLMPEIVTDEIGLLINKSNELIDALNAIRYKDVQKMGQAALMVAEGFNWLDIAKKHKQVYRRVLNKF